MRNWFRIDQDDGGGPTTNRYRIWAATMLLRHTSLDELQHLNHENNNLYRQSETFASGYYWPKFASGNFLNQDIASGTFWFANIYFRNSTFLPQNYVWQFLRTSSTSHLSISSLIGIERYRNFKIPDFILVWNLYSWLGLLPFHQAWLNDKFPFKGGLLVVKACFKNSSDIRYFNRLEYSQLRV